MIDGAAPPQPTLRARGAAHSVIEECLRIQADAPARGSLARFVGRSPLHPDARSWFSGALGEIAVGKRLASLPADWTVLHAVPVGSGDSDIDHVVIGPAGVFSINTKNHPGKKIWTSGGSLRVNNVATHHIRNSLHEAQRASRLLTSAGMPVVVTPLIAIVGAASISTGKTPPKVRVLSSTQLTKWLSRQPQVYSDVETRRLAALAEQPTTWHTHPAETIVSERQNQSFTRLQHEVADARRRGRLWNAAVTAATACGVGYFVMMLFPQLIAAAITP